MQKQTYTTTADKERMDAEMTADMKTVMPCATLYSDTDKFCKNECFFSEVCRKTKKA